MAILIPSSYSTFADGTRSEGPGSLRKYVLAQFRSDAEMTWVQQLRTELGADELKFKLFEQHRARLRANSELWKRVEAGVAQAALVVVDPGPIDRSIRSGFRDRGAELGVDFAEADVSSGAATALVAGTPLAWLPAELAKVFGQQDDAVGWPSPAWSRWPTPVYATDVKSADLTFAADCAQAAETAPDVAVSIGEISPKADATPADAFAPADIQARIGRSLRAATVFAARAHATFDVARLDESVVSTRDVFRSPLARLILRELLSTPRTFDTEDAKTVAVLNDASEHIASAFAAALPGLRTIKREPLVREADSRAIDHIQAADIAAGWARDIIDTAGVRALGNRFERVWVNGVLLKGPDMRLYNVEG